MFSCLRTSFTTKRQTTDRRTETGEYKIRFHTSFKFYARSWTVSSCKTLTMIKYDADCNNFNGAEYYDMKVLGRALFQRHLQDNSP